MKVLMISGEFPPMQGGVGDYTACLASALMSAGISCSVVTGANRGIPAAQYVWPRMPGWRLHHWPTLARLIRAHQPHVIHVQYQTAAYGMHPLINLLPFLMRAARVPAPLVTTFHDLRGPYLFPKAGPVRNLANWLLAIGSHVCVATNDEDMKRLTTIRGARPEGRRTALIPIGSNIAVNPPDHFSRVELRTQLGVQKDATLIAFFGLINETKGVDTLFQAIAGFPAEHPVRVVMIGGTAGDSDVTNGPYRQKVLDISQQLGVDDRVIWTGYSNPREVSALLLASDIAVLPFRDGASFRRGSLLAALAHSLPVVTTLARPDECPGAGELMLRDEENCLLVHPEDPPAVRAATLRLMVSSPLRERISRGAGILAQHFAWEMIATQTMSLYDEVLDHRDR